MFTTLEQGVNWIESVKRFGDKLDLTRITKACEMCGNPQSSLPVIHVAGTNGKGSTVSYLKYMLLENGYNVGTFTSPYIVHFNERINYNNQDISNEDLLHYINEVKITYDHYLEQYNDAITFFELVTLISFLYFKDKDVDIVIYEVGLGGLLDATNVVSPIITAITTIGFDHMGVLGNTLEEIALNKLGIVKQNIPLVTSVSDEELLELFERYTQKRNAELTVIHDSNITNIHYNSYTNFNYKKNAYQISMIGVHQVKNASLALEIINQIKSQYPTQLEANQQGLLKTHWPGRMERFGNIILDGAHNVEAALVLKESIQTLYKDKYIKVLYTSMEDKEYFDIIQIMESFCDEITFTEFDYYRCETAENLYNVSSHNNKHMSKDSYVSLQELSPKENEILLVTGSLYFISYIRKALV